MKKLFLMCGIPRAGKTTYIEKILKPQFKNLFVISPEALRLASTGSTTPDGRIESMIWWFARKLLFIYFKQGSEYDAIVIDATSTSVNMRKRWIETAKEVSAEIELIWIKTPVEEIRKRNLETDKVPEVSLELIIESFEIPTKTEGFSRLIEVDGTI